MPKAKLSVTIDAEVAARLDRAVAGGTSRSAVVEAALVAWLRRRRRQELEADIERYYEAMSDEEQDEDEAWAELGGRHADEVWR